jgi:hypothetical protein
MESDLELRLSASVTRVTWDGLALASPEQSSDQLTHNRQVTHRAEFVLGE